MVQSKIFPIILAGAMVLGLVACGSSDDATDTTTSKLTSESETPSESESAEPSETEGEEDELAPDGVWETDGERVTIEKDTVTIDYIDDEGEVTETYWVGSFELDEDSDTWTSTRDPNAEMTCESDTIEFTWSGEGDNVYDKLSYAVTNEDGTKTTVTLDRVESLGDVERGVGPAVSESDDTSASDSSTTQSSASASASASPSASSNSSDTASSNTASDTASSGSTGGASGSDTASSGNSSGSASSGSSGSASSGSSGSASSGNSSGSASSGNSSGNASSGNSSGSASSGSASSQHTHTYNAGVVTQQATCSTAGVKTYTCTTCGATKTESVPATGQHNWQAVYKTVHHDATGHYETTPVTESRYVCRICGWYQENVSGLSVSNQISYMQLHFDNAHDGYGSYEPLYVQVGTTSTWVVDSNAYDEQVVDYYKCSVCGATK